MHFVERITKTQEDISDEYPSIESGAGAAWLVTDQAGRDSGRLRPDGNALGTGADHSLSLLSRAIVQSFWQEYQRTGPASTGGYQPRSEHAQYQSRFIPHFSASNRAGWSYAACWRDSEPDRAQRTVTASK